MILDLDHQKFNKQYQVINDILIKSDYFMRIYELKKKLHYVTVNKPHQKKNIIGVCSSCIIKKFNGFYTVRIENEREIRKNFLSIDIIHDPVLRDNESINCYFLDQLNLDFKGNYGQGGKIHHCFAWQCYYCSNYFGRKSLFNRHFQLSCSGQPEIVHDFNT